MLRFTITDIMRKYYNESLAAIEDNIKTIAATDTATRNTLAAQTQFPCVTNLANFVDQITELSGYAISNCIDAQDSENDNVTSDALTTLDDFERDVNSFAVVIINALIGHNIFTEGQAIVDRVQEQLDAKKTKYADLFVQFNSNPNDLASAYDSEVVTLNACFGDILTSINSGLAQVQLPVCIKFGGRGARFLVALSAADFFPGLKVSE